MTGNTLKVGVQSFGRFLSGMVMPNIGAFIAWGLITALFIPTGWLPNEQLASLVGPMIKYLLPLLIGFTGGKMVGGDRGAVAGAVTTMGVIVGSDIPMFMGAMIAGPLGGLAITKFDQRVHGKIKPGFEMLVNNFSLGIISMVVALIAYRSHRPGGFYRYKGTGGRCGLDCGQVFTAACVHHCRTGKNSVFKQCHQPWCLYTVGRRTGCQSSELPFII
jgi:mannitol-specific phosphotransferase system IIBC component